MARIPVYTRTQSLNPASAPQPTFSTAGAQALQNVGGSIQDAAATFMARAEAKENFAADNAYRKLNLQLTDQLEQAREQIPEGGDGFHDQFMSDVFKPARDQFLSGLPERLRPQFEELLSDQTGADFTRWSIEAASAERDETYRWFKQELGATQEQLATAIAMRPEEYDAYLQAGMANIDSSGLPTAEKAVQKQQWERMAQVAHLNQLLQDNPHQVLRELGVDTRQLSPTTQFDLLSRAVIQQESSGDPNARSHKGASGLMQIMPATAADIARELEDPNFPWDGGTAAIQEYLTNPRINVMYGEHYLRNMMLRHQGHPRQLELALIDYNSGPNSGQAQRWIESGYDDAVLYRETRDYKNKIMADIAAPATKVAPSTVGWTHVGGTAFVDDGGVAVPDVNRDLRDRVATAYAALGLDNVKVISSGRSATQNATAGGAEGSQHLQNNALDLDVTGMPHAKRVELIRALSGAGVTGIGVYANTIHADLGGRRAWGPSHTGNDIPKWAQTVIGQHMAGTAAPIRSTGGRYASLPYDDRQNFIQNADRAVAAQAQAAAQSTAVEKVLVRQAMDNEIATLAATGVGTGFDETQISTVLGEADYLRYVERRDIAARSYSATNPIKTMTYDDMENHRLLYQPVAGTSTFDADSQVYQALLNEIDRVERLRARTPGDAALEFPDVAEAYSVLQQGMQDPNSAGPTPEEVQTFVRLMFEKQAEFNVRPDAQAPIPRDWAMQIGRTLSQIPEQSGRNLFEVQAEMMAQYDSLREFFGDFTDEVIIYAVSEYRNMSPANAEALTSMMSAVRAGSDPFRTVRARMGVTNAEDAIEAVRDRENVEMFSIMGLPVTVRPGSLADRMLGGAATARRDEAAGPRAEPVDPSGDISPEIRRRILDSLQAAGDDPLNEAVLAHRYGASVVEAVKRSMAVQ